MMRTSTGAVLLGPCGISSGRNATAGRSMMTLAGSGLPREPGLEVHLGTIVEQRLRARTVGPGVPGVAWLAWRPDDAEPPAGDPADQVEDLVQGDPPSPTDVDGLGLERRGHREQVGAYGIAHEGEVP